MKKDNINKTFAVNYGHCDKDVCTCDTTSYRCGVCGKSFETIESRSACEAKCLKDRAKAEEALKKQKLEEEKAKSKAEIEKKYKELAAMVSEHIRKFGSLQIGERRIFDDGIFPTLDKILGWWF